LKFNYETKSLKTSEIPVLLTLHVRSSNLENQLSILKRAGIERIFVSIDGARDDTDYRNQKIINQILNLYKHEFREFKVRKLSENQGIAVAMITAIDWFFSRNQYGVIFEDDIEFQVDTLKYFALSLPKIKELERVLLISGFQPFFKSIDQEQVVFTNYPQIWGWATYSEKWLEMRKYILEQPPIMRKIELAKRKFWQVGWQRVQKGYLDTWDLPIATGMLFANKLCMLPPSNLTSNVGADAYSTNTHVNTFPLGVKIEKLPLELRFEIPSNEAEIIDINSKFEAEIYQIKRRNILSLQLSRLDRFRFRHKKRSSLKARLQLLSGS